MSSHRPRWFGSSPLTRGKQACELPQAALVRLIPAHAGKTSPHTAPASAEPAHPRSRGENASTAERRSHIDGSSPLTRGKRPRRRLFTSGLRLIPAHAGKTNTRTTAPALTPAHPRSRGQTQLCLSSSSLMPAHPRSRGENPDGGKYTAGRSGSSPLTRGKLRLD